ncbi:alpha/beta hydrolase fold-3 domain-containing protein [Dendryphion nanum]|uniref:Alpha/beta hydrolase fold-3 domain-containing protein n=1 Tax=Dendryphion nanum TaxID=256645 RepID=A0A9P9ID26_9PLEO|nr:alpha/beta hydrolase fold-3 domain-containing protein [Dendryphion nanum]
MADFSQYGGASAEWLAVEKTLPSLTFDISKDPVELQRAVNEQREQLSKAALEPLLPHVKITAHTIPTRDGSTIEAHSYRSVTKDASEKLPAFLYFHGGGFLFGGSNNDAAAAKAAVKTGALVLSVNYRHTPHHTFPTAWHDTQDSFAWLHANAFTLNIDPEKVVVGGVSAGGQLTASLVLEKHLGKSDVLNGLPAIAGQILIIPALADVKTYADGPLKRIKSPELSSYVENENAPLLPKRTIDFFMRLLKPDDVELKDTKLNIVNATVDEVRGLPPTVFGIAGLDPLRDEALLYAQTLSEAHVPTQTLLFKGVPHGYRRFGNLLKASEDWDRAVEEGLLWTLSKPQATGKFDVEVLAR